MYKKRVTELDVFTGIAILFVVLIHANALYLNNYGISKFADMRVMFNTIFNVNYTHSLFPIIFNLIDKVVHVAVPIFIFIAGYKFELNNKQEHYFPYLKKKINQVLKPFLAVSIFFLLAISFKGILLDHIGLIDSCIQLIKGVILIFLGVNRAYQLWYVPMYLFLVLSYPIIIKYIKNENVRWFIFSLLALIWITLDEFVPFIKTHPHPFSFIYYFYLFELGVMFSKKKYAFNSIFIYLYIVALAVSIIIPNNFIVVFTEAIVTPLAVIALFNIAIKIKYNYVLTQLNKYSFYIFLFHEPVFVTSFTKVFVKLGIDNYLIVVGISTIGAVLMSIFATFVISKIPVFNSLFNLKKQKLKTKVIKNRTIA